MVEALIGRSKKPRVYIPSDDEDADKEADADSRPSNINAFTQKLAKFKKSPTKKKSKSTLTQFYKALLC